MVLVFGSHRSICALSLAILVANCRNYGTDEESGLPSSGGSPELPGSTGGAPPTQAGEGGARSLAGSSSIGEAEEAPTSMPNSPPGVGPSPESSFGAVRLLVNGAPRCSGTLLTNSWVLTADQCVPSETEPGAIDIGFGADSARFDQVRSVVEIVRFPGNDGSAGARGRDLLLLGVDAPFTIDGSDRLHHIALDTRLPHSALTTLRCVGWDLSPDPRSDTSKLHSELFTGVALQYNVELNARAAGHRLWWSNTANDPSDGVLPMPDDAGTGCFFTLGQTSFLAAVHSGNPARLRQGGENDGREAFGQVIPDPEVHGWVDRTLFGIEEHALEVAGDPGLCSLSPGTFELFATQPDGGLGHFHFDGSFEGRSSLSPPDGASLSNHRPGVFCTPSGGVELFVVDSDGRAWQRSWPAGDPDWSPDWKRLVDATTRITSGLATAGATDDHFYVFGAGESSELRYAEFDRGWTGKWQDLGGSLDGAPVARAPQEGRIDVFLGSKGNGAHQVWMANGVWQAWVQVGGTLGGDPAIASWRSERVDLFARSESGSLLRRIYDFSWGEWVDTKLPIPSGTFAGVTSELGHVDLLVTDQGNVWLARWPRSPAPMK